MKTLRKKFNINNPDNRFRVLFYHYIRDLAMNEWDAPVSLLDNWKSVSRIILLDAIYDAEYWANTNLSLSGSWITNHYLGVNDIIALSKITLKYLEEFADTVSEESESYLCNIAVNLLIKNYNYDSMISFLLMGHVIGQVDKFQQALQQIRDYLAKKQGVNLIYIPDNHIIRFFVILVYYYAVLYEKGLISLPEIKGIFRDTGKLMKTTLANTDVGRALSLVRQRLKKLADTWVNVNILYVLEAAIESFRQK